MNKIKFNTIMLISIMVYMIITSAVFSIFTFSKMQNIEKNQEKIINIQKKIEMQK